MVPGWRTRTRNRNLQCRHLRWTGIFGPPDGVVVAESRLAGVVYGYWLCRLRLGDFVAQFFPKPFRMFLVTNGRTELYFGANGLSNEDSLPTQRHLASTHGSEDHVGIVLDPGMLRLHHASVPFLAAFLFSPSTSHVVSESKLVYRSALRGCGAVGIAYRQTKRQR